MKLLLSLLLLALIATKAPARAQESGGSAYAVAGIAVDVAAPNPEVARNTAFRIAQRRAWPLLWARLTGSAVGSAPHLSDSQLDSIVSGIESQGERFSATRYIAKLGVVFDRVRTSAFLGRSGIGGDLTSPPMLLLPLMSDGGARTLFQTKTPWRAAWQRYRENVTPIDYVLAAGSAGDNLLLTNWQVKRPDRPSWRNILNRFDTVDVLTAEARLVRAWPGGPITGTFIARHGPDATELGRAVFRAPDEAGLDTMLDSAVRAIDEIYSAALRDGRLRSEPDLTADLAPIIGNAPLIGVVESGDTSEAGAISASLEVVMATPDAATASGLESTLRGTPGIAAVTITSLSLGGTSRLFINYTSARDALVYELDQRGLRLLSENGQMVIRRRREGELPVPKPVSASSPADPAAPTTPAKLPPQPVPTSPAAPAKAPPALPPATAGDAAKRPVDAAQKPPR